MVQAPFVLALLPTIILGIICRLALGGPYRPGAGTAATYERSVLTGGEPEANGAPNNLIPLPGWWAPFLDVDASLHPPVPVISWILPSVLWFLFCARFSATPLFRPHAAASSRRRTSGTRLLFEASLGAGFQSLAPKSFRHKRGVTATLRLPVSYSADTKCFCCLLRSAIDAATAANHQPATRIPCCLTVANSSSPEVLRRSGRRSAHRIAIRIEEELRLSKQAGNEIVA
ncbi:hypothetical protein ASPNIDRAFT_40518 [Aspergillus niger ATCC 1015]|uniref:Uncharacterized protein n=1 Tax=Aspergillus niger (strain ATCC 1015 / CBS 113.46 / FGSC A1144 / LSHB Ac4 / NCTC 3858a / NRRL 328 / USDA 3528.7) TaxID=380704 RepID=G3XXY7_ASPNA|nr:hypothetical protein ASPNIDRAFT_40518 [Aspergillus niger ATCC 1015]